VNTWVQTVAVFNFGVDKTLTVYKNGVFSGSRSLAGVNQVSNTNFVSMAGRVTADGSSALNMFKGTIGIIRMYDSSLTASQVLQNFDADKSKYGL
jgi:Neuraminidase (sialidase)